jgi:hypothetical protein
MIDAFIFLKIFLQFQRLKIVETQSIIQCNADGDVEKDKYTKTPNE